MSVPTAHIKFQYAELNKLDKQLEMMQQWGVAETDPGYLKLIEARNVASWKIGREQPMTAFQIARAFGLSPGVIALWTVGERGWMSEAREREGAPPVYKYVSDKVAEKIVKDELTHEEFEQLLIPDEYIGE